MIIITKQSETKRRRTNEEKEIIIIGNCTRDDHGAGCRRMRPKGKRQYIRQQRRPETGIK